MKAFALNLDHQQVPVDVKYLTKRHLLITGQTGSGKTTTTLALLSNLQNQNITTIVLDPTGEYTRLPNTTVYRLGENAYFDAGQLNGEQLTFLTNTSSQLVPFIDRAITSLRVMQNINGKQSVLKKIGLSIKEYQEQLRQLGDWSKSYPIQLLPQQMIEEMIVPFADEHADYSLLGQQYYHQLISDLWADINQFREQLLGDEFETLFSIQQNTSQPLTELNYVLHMFLNQASEHTTLVIDLSILKHFENCQRLLISILLKQILNYRMQHPRNLPVKLVIDEAHRYLPDDEHLFANGIFQIAREGRKGQLSLILTTQSPLDLPNRLRSQFSNVIVHHLNDRQEQAVLNLKDDQLATKLKVGEAFIRENLKPLQKVHVNLPEWDTKEDNSWHI